MQKDFDKWNEEKKKVNKFKNIDEIFFYEREIWWVALGVNVGFEQDGKGEEFHRPVLILKKFNKYVVLAVTLTTRIKKGNIYYVPCIVEEDILRMAIISQIRLIDTKRLIDKIGAATEQSFIEIKNAIKAML